MMPGMVAELLAKVQDLNEKIDGISKTIPSQEQNIAPRHKAIGIDEVSRIIGKAKGTLYRMSSKGQIPCYRQGRSLIFFEDEIYQWIGLHKKVDMEAAMQQAKAFAMEQEW